MKKNKIIIIIILSFFEQNLLFSQLYPPEGACYTSWLQSISTGCSNDPYILIFDDYFHGNSLDHSKWYTDPGDGEGMPRCFNWVPNTWYIPENVIVNNEVLSLKTEYLPIPAHHQYVSNCIPLQYMHDPGCTNYGDFYGNQEYNEDFYYTSGEVTSACTFGQGIYEIYCKLPPGNNPYPAFWIFGGNSIYETIRIAQEIDVFENQNNEYDHNLKMNVHYNGGDCGYNSTPLSCHLEDGFHKVTVLWDDFKIQYSVDGLIVRTYYKNYRPGTGDAFLLFPVDCNDFNGTTNYYQNPNYLDPNIHLSFILGNGTSRNCSANDQFPNSFEVQYVKYYKQIPNTTCSSDITISNEDVDNTSVNSLIHYLHPVQPWPYSFQRDYSSIVGHSIVFAGNNNTNDPSVYLPYIKPHNNPIDPYNTNEVLNGSPYWCDNDPYDQLEAIASSSIDLLPGFEVDALKSNVFTYNLPNGYYDEFLLKSYFEAKIDPNLCNGYNPNTTVTCAPERLRKIDKHITFENSLQVYPNPSNGIITLKINNQANGSYHFVLTDISGRQITDRNDIINGTNTLDESMLDQGLYIYKVYSSNELIGNGKIAIVKGN